MRPGVSFGFVFSALVFLLPTVATAKLAEFLATDAGTSKPAPPLLQRPDERAYFLSIIGTDPDLTTALHSKEFHSIVDRIRVGH